jgi:hypothetical protein
MIGIRRLLYESLEPAPFLSRTYSVLVANATGRSAALPLSLGVRT